MVIKCTWPKYSNGGKTHFQKSVAKLGRSAEARQTRVLLHFIIRHVKRNKRKFTELRRKGQYTREYFIIPPAHIFFFLVPIHSICI